MGDHRGPPEQRPAGASTLSFDERLRTPWWWYPAALVIAAILAAQFRLADENLTVWIPYGVMLPGSLVLVWLIGRRRTYIADGVLHARAARLPTSAIGQVLPLDPATVRLVMGREGDPSAFLATRAWIGPGVQIVLDDPDDPTPYWVVSTRRPDELARVLKAATREPPGR